MEPSLPPIPSNGTDKVLIVLCHLSLFLGVGFLLPLIVFLVKNQEAPLVGAHAREVLNFHISILIYTLVCIPFILIVIGLVPLLGLALLAFICAIIGAIQASEGRFYRYPVTIRFF